MPAKINKEWHEANPMPRPATMDNRIAWHLEHRRNCACRDLPVSILLELAKRGTPAEAPRD
jgi:hypothetical protein